MNTNYRIIARIIALGFLLVGSVSVLLRGQSLPPEKQTIENQYSQERATGAQNPAPKNPAAPYPIAPEQPFPMGVLNDCAPPFSSEEASIENCWAGLLNGVKTIVYAGAEANDIDPQQGLVYVVSAPTYPAPVSGNRVLTPVKAGSVRIVAAQSPLLMLVTASGSYVLTFNINTATFTSVTTTPLVLVAANQVVTTASGLAYSRATQTFTGTVTVKNISGNAIAVPLSVVFAALTSGVTLLNATGAYNGNPDIAMPLVTTLAPGQTVTTTVQFSNPSNGAINFTPVVYSGSL